MSPGGNHSRLNSVKLRSKELTILNAVVECVLGTFVMMIDGRFRIFGGLPFGLVRFRLIARRLWMVSLCWEWAAASCG